MVVMAWLTGTLKAPHGVATMQAASAMPDTHTGPFLPGLEQVLLLLLLS